MLEGSGNERVWYNRPAVSLESLITLQVRVAEVSDLLRLAFNRIDRLEGILASMADGVSRETDRGRHAAEEDDWDED